jgi:hypothetical protein
MPRTALPCRTAMHVRTRVAAGITPRRGAPDCHLAAVERPRATRARW